MEYISTRNNQKIFTFKDIFLKGLADDGGLFIPKSVKPFSKEEINNFKNLSYNDLAAEIINPFIGDFMSKDDLISLISKSYSNFRTKNVVNINKLGNLKVLELFHGPTLAFKDIAMQLIGNFYEHHLNFEQKKINIVVATSGDTGAAAIDALKGKKNLNVFVLHPNNRISPVQRKLMTTCEASNVFNIAIQGNFDDCQNLVKAMFNDEKFSKSINMSGVNSINWARIIAQAVYYFYAYFKVGNGQPLSFSVPTGNFGDIYAGYLAKKLGLPIDKLVVATNKNDILHRAISGGDYSQKKVMETNTPSMDIQIASNFERLLYDVKDCNSEVTKDLMIKIKNNTYKIDTEDLGKIQKNFISEMLDENETIEMIKKINDEHQTVVDPHTAVGIGAVKKLGIEKNCVVLSTAHPCKFPKAIEDAIFKTENLPNSLKYVNERKEKFELLSNDIQKVKKYVMNSI
ncbi:threonine synthase [Candidatus Pelagibacter communis]|uniref:threonine synthase n=1 Tax=Pelagibacter ubique TaxID=198252 RepID=UPI00094D672E|nr:threonine synthase [Candidatus Pelagibacter ubique]